MLVTNDIAAAYYAKVPNSKMDDIQGGFVYPCNQTVPDFSVHIGDYKATVPGEFITFAPVDNANTTCYGGVQGSSSLGFSIYGATFLKSQWVLFDGGNKRIGFAPKPLKV